MISEPKTEPAAGLAAWAAEQLGVPLHSPTDVSTRTFLRRLADEDFMPPPSLRMAWELTTARWPAGRSAPPWLADSAEVELRGRIEQFAGQFFNIPPEQRKAQWERLHAEAEGWPRLAVRLRHLQSGLAIEFPPLPALGLRGEAKLMQLTRELFPLPPGPRAVRRRQMLRQDIDGDIRPWQKAAQQLRDRRPHIAALAPDLLVPLATWGQTVRAAAKSSLVRGGVNVDGKRVARRSVLNGLSLRYWWLYPILGAFFMHHITSIVNKPSPEPWRQQPPYYSNPAPTSYPDLDVHKLIREATERRNEKARSSSPQPESPPPILPKSDLLQPPNSATPLPQRNYRPSNGPATPPSSPSPPPGGTTR